MNISQLIIQALQMKQAFGIRKAAGFLRNKGFSVEQAIAILARPVRIVVPFA